MFYDGCASSYTNWRSGAPHGSATGHREEDCAFSYSSYGGKWDDAPCYETVNDQYNCICQRVGTPGT